MPLQYQLIILGPNARLFDELVTDESGVAMSTRDRLFASLRELGLDPTTDLALLDAARRSQLDARCSNVGLWYGGDSPFEGEAEHMEALKSLQAMGVLVFPLVESLGSVSRNIPKSLQLANALAWADTRLPGDVLKAFGLTRELRQAFISYKRTDSEGIAKQLAHTLFDRGFLVFLDTASVERGVPFQDVLHDRLANIDLVVLLDSPNALQSMWVHEELDMVNQLGLGVLQLAWTKPDPDVPGGLKLQATPGTEFSTRFPLESSHFLDPAVTLGRDAMLTQDALRQVADLAEQARIRSLGARRMRVVSYLQAEASRLDLMVNIQPAGPVEILRNGEVISTAYPIIGLPDAWVVFEQQAKILKTLTNPDYGIYRILYDGLGIMENRLGHLAWLNEHLELKTLRTELLKDWLSHP